MLAVDGARAFRAWTHTVCAIRVAGRYRPYLNFLGTTYLSIELA